MFKHSYVFTPHPVTGTFQCSGEEEYLPLSALCNGTNECTSGHDETNTFCASELTSSLMIVFMCMQTGVSCRTMEAVPTTESVSLLEMVFVVETVSLDFETVHLGMLVVKVLL